MTIDQLIYFVNIYKTRSFSKTARDFYISQPAISLSMKKLEDELDVSLFNRENGQLIVTQAAKYFYNLANPIVVSFNNLNTQMKDYLNKNININVGIPPMLGIFIFVPIFNKFNKEFPNINLQLTELASKANQNAILDNQLDIALAVTNKELIDPNLSYTKIGKTELLFCVSKSNPLAGLNKISFKDIGNYPILLLKQDSLQYKILLDTFKKYEIEPNIRLLTDQIITIKELLSYGETGAFLFKQIIKDNDDIIGIPLVEDTNFDIVIVTKKDAFISEPVQKFYDFLKENI